MSSAILVTANFDDEKLVSTDEAAKLLDMPINDLLRQIRQGRVIPVTVKGRNFLKMRDVNRLQNQRPKLVPDSRRK